MNYRHCYQQYCQDRLDSLAQKSIQSDSVIVYLVQFLSNIVYLGSIQLMCALCEIHTVRI